MFSEGQSKARIGKVSIDIKANRYRIRFSYPKGKRHELRIAQVNDDGWLTALKAAKLINRDIDLLALMTPMLVILLLTPKLLRLLEIRKKENTI